MDFAKEGDDSMPQKPLDPTQEIRDALRPDEKKELEVAPDHPLRIEGEEVKLPPPEFFRGKPN